MNRILAAKSGWGKSYHAQAIMESSIPEYEVAAILDFKDEYRGLVKAGYARHFIAGENEKNWSVAHWKEFLRQNRKVVIARYRLSPEEWRGVAANITLAARQLAQKLGSALIAIDEAHFVAPQSGKVPESLEGLATTGRGEGALGLWVTQRLAKMEEDILSQCQERLLGGFNSDADLNKVGSVVEYPKDLHNPQVSRVPNLPTKLEADDGPLSVRKFLDDDDHTIGSEWVYSNDRGDVERRDTSSLSMQSTHYGPEGNDFHDPNYE